MRRCCISRFAVAALTLAATVNVARAQDPDRVVEDGGILVPGWMGTIDNSAAEAGQTVENARFAFAADGDAFHITTGPASTYWNSADRVTGEYTVSATFTEPEYMSLNNHPHPYGIVIAGDDMGEAGQSYLYCAAYGNGRFIVRGFGPEPFQLNGRGETHQAVNEAAGPNEPVTQQIALSVRDGAVSCEINGTVVASYPIADVVAAGRLASTDGVYGVRAAHNTDVIVSDLSLTRY